MEADNYNRNYMLWGARIINGTNGTDGLAPAPGFVVRNNTLVSADFPAEAGKQYGIYDQISRPGEKSSTEFFSLSGKWDVSEKLRFFAEGGTSEGHGETPTQDVAEWDVALGTGAAWRLNGVGAASWNLGSANTAAPGTPGTDINLDFIFGFQDMDVETRKTG